MGFTIWEGQYCKLISFVRRTLLEWTDDKDIGIIILVCIKGAI
jgi:hypothetical protein